MSEIKEYILQPRDQFCELDDIREINKKVASHLERLRFLKSDGYTHVILTRALLADSVDPTSTIQDILRLKKWVQCPMTCTLSISIDTLIELMENK